MSGCSTGCGGDAPRLPRLRPPRRHGPPRSSPSAPAPSEPPPPASTIVPLWFSVSPKGGMNRSGTNLWQLPRVVRFLLGLGQKREQPEITWTPEMMWTNEAASPRGSGHDSRQLPGQLEPPSRIGGCWELHRMGLRLNASHPPRPASFGASTTRSRMERRAASKVKHRFDSLHRRWRAGLSLTSFDPGDRGARHTIWRMTRNVSETGPLR